MIHRLHGVVEVGWSSAIMHTVHNDTQLELNPPAYRSLDLPLIHNDILFSFAVVAFSVCLSYDNGYSIACVNIIISHCIIILL